MMSEQEVLCREEGRLYLLFPCPDPYAHDAKVPGQSVLLVWNEGAALLPTGLHRYIMLMSIKDDFVSGQR